MDWMRGPEFHPDPALADAITQTVRRTPVVARASLHGRLRPRHAFALARHRVAGLSHHEACDAVRAARGA
jgi:hypothetical protein